MEVIFVTVRIFKPTFWRELNILECTVTFQELSIMAIICLLDEVL
jgi:hypothetical protein